jgi:hypothetical protein
MRAGRRKWNLTCVCVQLETKKRQCEAVRDNDYAQLPGIFDQPAEILQMLSCMLTLRGKPCDFNGLKI